MEDLNFAIPDDRFDNSAHVKRVIGKVPANVRGAVSTALSYLYFSSGPVNLSREKLKLAEQYVEPREKILLRWLFTRTNGSLRSSYGKNALIAARNSHYRCETCGFADVRALHIDHIDGRIKETQYACLCANCHNIKSRAKDWSGEKRYDRKA